MSKLDEIQARHTKVTAWWLARHPDHSFTESRQEIGKMITALRAVEAAHQPAKRETLIGPYCTGCTSPIDGGPELWPCPTIRAIQESLQENS